MVGGGCWRLASDGGLKRKSSDKKFQRGVVEGEGRKESEEEEEEEDGWVGFLE